MKSNFFTFFVCLTLFFSCTNQKSGQENQEDNTITNADTNEPDDDWVKLFNGNNLDGWTMKIVGHEVGDNFGNTFRVTDDGVLQIRYDAYDTFEGRFGGLYYDKVFENYRLKVEYRFVGEEFTKGAPEWGYRDSGIQFHCQDPRSLGLEQPFPVCLEYNLHGGNGTDDRPVGEICANGINVEVNGVKNENYCTPATVSRTFHGDDWVTLEIDVKGDQIIHFVNGEEILRYANPRYNPDHELGKEFIEDGNDVVDHGYISLQSNSHPIDFRSIEIKEYN